MKALFLYLSIILIWTSCTNNKQNPSTANTQGKKKGANVVNVTTNPALSPQKSTAKANATVQFQVSGMVCKMGCGGAIKKELGSTGAVEFVDVSFEEDQPSQSIVVYYDAKKTNPVKLTEQIERVNDGNFSVVGVRKEPFDAKALQALMK